MSLPNVVNQVRRGDPLTLGKALKLSNRQQLERAFETMLKTGGVTGWVREHQFHPSRKWRIDFAFPAAKLAVELDGLLYDGPGGHQTVDGICADAEKAEALLVAGWRLYRVPGQWLRQRPLAVIDTITELLGAEVG